MGRRGVGDMSVTEIAWAAGFFDGEGSVFVRHTRRHKGGTGKDYPLTTVEVSLAQVRPEPILRFHNAMGFGKVGGPYGGRKNHSPYFRWNTAGRPSAHRLAVMLWPYLSSPKREQFRRCWEELALLKTPKSPVLPELPND